MKFACESCNTKYLIPDERVVGRMLRVRCKRCSNIMDVVGPSRSPTKVEKLGAIKAQQDTAQDRPLFSVRGGSMDPFARVTDSGVWGVQGVPRGSARSDGMMGVQTASSPRRSSGPAADPMWWMAIKGEPSGPYTSEEVGALAERGRIHKKTRVWRPGMESWLRLRDVGELSHIRAPERTSVPANGELTPAAGSSAPPPLPETAFLTPAGHPFANLLSSQPPPPFSEPPISSAELTPPPVTRTGGTGWYVVSETEAQHLFAQVEDAPKHAQETSAQLTGHHLTSRNVHLAYGVAAGALLMALLLALAAMPDLMPRTSDVGPLVNTPVRAPVSSRRINVVTTPEEVEALQMMVIPRPVVEPAPAVTEPAAEPRAPRQVGSFKKAMSRQARQLLKD